jgi:hypothetical protein
MVRQLMALRTDLVRVSASRNEPTRDTLCPTTPELTRRHLRRVRRPSCTAERDTFAAAARIRFAKIGEATDWQRSTIKHLTLKEI